MKNLFSIILLLLTAELSAQNFYKELNAIRKENGISPAKRSLFLQVNSYLWARKCVNKYNSHLMHDRKGGFEVIAYNVDPIEWWMNSKPHKKTLLNNRLKKVGYGQYKGYAVARFK